MSLAFLTRLRVLLCGPGTSLGESLTPVVRGEEGMWFTGRKMLMAGIGDGNSLGRTWKGWRGV